MNTFERYLRLGRTAAGYWRRKLRPGYMPIRLWLDLTGRCNLRCVMCPQSMDREFPRGNMTWELFTKIIDEAKEFAWDVNLHHTGESTLHPRLIDMIEYAVDAGLYTRMHSNGTLLKPERSRAMIDAGLHFLSFSVDGYDKETYEEIRVNAEYETTVGNIVEFHEIKQELDSSTPYTIIETIEFVPSEGNPEEQKKKREFRSKFDGLPVNEIISKPPHNWAGSYEPPEASSNGSERDFLACTFPWYALVIFWDGRVAPCPQDWYCERELGNVNDSTIREIWNDEPMRELRKAMKTKSCGSVTPCNECDMIRRKSVFGLPKKTLKNYAKEHLVIPHRHED